MLLLGFVTDVQEDKEKQKWRDQAKREVEEWYKNRAEQLEKAKKNNKYGTVACCFIGNIITGRRLSCTQI